MAKFWHYIPDDPIKVFGAYSTSVSVNTVTYAEDAFSYLNINESGRPTGTVILVYGSDDIYTFIMLDTDWFEFHPTTGGFTGLIFDTHPTHSNHASATVGGTKRNVMVLPAYVLMEGTVTRVVDWYYGYGAPLNGTLYTAPKTNLRIVNYTGTTLGEEALRSTSAGGIYLDNFSLQGVNDIQENAFLNENITTNRDVTITNMAEIPAWHSRWNIINSNTNSYYRVKLTKMLHGDNPVFGAIVNGQPVTEIRNGSDLVHKKYYGDSVPPTATYVRNNNNTVWTINSPADDLFDSSFTRTYWTRSGTTPGGMSSWSSSTTENTSYSTTISVSRWENHYLETYVQNSWPVLSSKSITVSRPRAINPLTLTIFNTTSTGATLNIANNSGIATTGYPISINQNNGTNTSYTGVISNGTSVNVPLTGVNPNTNVTVTLQNIFLSGISNSFSQTTSYTTLPTPKTATPTILGVSCRNTSGGLMTNSYRVSVQNNDSAAATIRVNSTDMAPALAAGATGTFTFHTGRVPYTYSITVSATASGKTISNSVSDSGEITVCGVT